MKTERKFSTMQVLGIVIIFAIVASGITYVFLTLPEPPTDDEIVITVLLSGQELSLDAPQTTGAVHQTICNILYDRLVHFLPNSTIVPMLATNWTVTDNGTDSFWTFTLRDDVTFHSGLPLNASHVAAGFLRIINEPVTGALASFDKIVDAEALDAHTVKFTIDGFYSPLLTSFAYSTGGINNPEAVEQYGVNYTYHIDATGPYKLESYDPGVQTVLVANDDYWGGRPAIDKIIFKNVADPAARNVALQTGEAQVGDLLNVPDLPVLRANAELEVNILYERSLFFWVNCANMSKEVRQALNYAINKTAIVEDIYGGDAVMTTTPIPPQVRFADDQTPYPYNKTKARELLNAAGWLNETEIVMRSTYGRYPLVKEVTEFVQAELESLNLTTKIVTADFGSHLAAIRENSTEADWHMGIIGWGTSTGDPDYIMKSWFYGTGSSAEIYNPFFKNSTVDGLIELGQNQTLDADREQYYALAQEMVWQEAVCLWLNIIPEVYANHISVNDVHYMPTGAIDLRDAWVNATLAA
jgi:peptide/nickel transport system substrate-binding protein